MKSRVRKVQNSMVRLMALTLAVLVSVWLSACRCTPDSSESSDEPTEATSESAPMESETETEPAEELSEIEAETESAEGLTESEPADETESVEPSDPAPAQKTDPEPSPETAPETEPDPEPSEPYQPQRRVLVSTSTIRAFGGQILGTIETYSNGDRVARAFGGVIKGYYYASDDTTRDFSGRIVAYGDVVSALLYE